MRGRPPDDGEKRRGDVTSKHLACSISAAEAMKVPKKASQIAGSNSSVCRPGTAFTKTRHWMSKSNWRQIKCLSSVLLRWNSHSSGECLCGIRSLPREFRSALCCFYWSPQIQSESKSICGVANVCSNPAGKSIFNRIKRLSSLNL